MTDHEIEALDNIRALIAEHFTNFAFAVITEDASLFYDYKDRYVGKALFVESI